MNWKNVLRFSGDGDVTKTFAYPIATAPATAMPIAADLPRPRAAVSATVDLSVFSDAASRKVTTALPWSRVLQQDTRAPAGSVPSRDCLSSLRSSDSAPTSVSLPTGWRFWTCDEIGRTLSSSSMMMHVGQNPRERMNRSLNRPTTCWCDSVLNRECTSIVMVYSCDRLSMFDSSSTIMPPPSTVSTVRASRFGVSASKSWSTAMP
mmetsp:Transcript_6734/g.27868  ORF Transcript_6734/g.27868 Transcript_6734/m.27868 type:complete len:206 (+) Transcript_6734:479-1096(+)